MKQWISISIFILIMAVLVPSTGCTSRAISSEAAQSLIQMNKAAVADIDSQIALTDKQLYNTQEQLLKLEQVLNAALEWVNYQKTVAKPGKWNIKVTPSGLIPFQNDRYQVTALEFLSTKDIVPEPEFSYTIKIRDLDTMQIDDGDTFKSNLDDMVNLQQTNRSAMVDARDLSVSTMNNVLKYVNDWKVKKVSGTTYSVSGPGLGWSEQLSSGTWKYDRDKGTLVPEDKPAADLNTIILVELTPQ
jgi:hypothetical protein